MTKHAQVYTVFLLFVCCTSFQRSIISPGPKTITRNIIQDRKGKLWFGSIGAGVFRFDGKSFKNFTIRDGLLNDEIICIYEDKTGNIWFGVNGGASRYDGRSFRNYMLNGDSMTEVRKGITFPDMTRPPNEVMSIAEDKNGRFWFGTRGETFVYDGKKFTILTHDGKSFTNFRSIIADKKGNIWTNSQHANDAKWVLSRYDEKSLSDLKPTVTEIFSKYTDDRGMVFGILMADDGNIWLGVLGGVRRYDRKTIISLCRSAS